MRGRAFVVGIDEAGRGPLAGPVAVAAVRVSTTPRAKRALTQAFPVVKDSKQLTPKRREEWFAVLQKLKRAGHVSCGVTLVSAKVIDAHGISAAIARGLEKSLAKAEATPKRSSVLLDGGLKAPRRFDRQKTIIRGDATHLEIALASVVAKVTRDRRMDAYARVHTKHAFEKHKGYGTGEHIKLIRKYGLTPIHRRSFCRNIVLDR